MSKHQDLKKWNELAEKQMKGKPVENLNWKTPEGIEVKPLYTAGDIEGLPQVDSLPGFALRLWSKAVQ